MTPAEACQTKFERLSTTNFRITSPLDVYYNCIAFAAADSRRWWWPTGPFLGGQYWPPEAPRENTVHAFVVAFQSLGFVPCDNDVLESRFEKVAIYAAAGVPKHAARQLPNGEWTSKLGSGFDIIHDDPHCVSGREYGEVVTLLRRPLTDP